MGQNKMCCDDDEKKSNLLHGTNPELVLDLCCSESLKEYARHLDQF
jgi:hypothetical protein